MQILKVSVLITLVFCCSCKALNSTNDSQVLGDNTRWMLTAIEQKSLNLSEQAYLQFNTKEYTISGKAACNTFSAEYEMLTGNRITVSDIISTKMYCEGAMDEENQILTNLRDVIRYEIKADKLYLFGDEGLLLTFERR